MESPREIKDRINRPLAALIAESNCSDLGCPPDKEPYYCCKVDPCGDNDGWFAEYEKERRFTLEQRELIESLFDTETGYLGDDGCRLANEDRALMSIKCLRTIIQMCYNSRVKGNYHVSN